MPIRSLCSYSEHPFDASHNICSIVSSLLSLFFVATTMMLRWFLSHATMSVRRLRQPVIVGVKNNRVLCVS
jgi:hypothetical protein